MAIVPREDRSSEPNSGETPSRGWSEREDTLLDEVDRILDKISAEGMGSLTPAERKVLDDVSKRHRSN
jgi:hypothetical protein